MDKPVLHYNRFSSYQVSIDNVMATVPDAELQKLIEFANLAVAAGPAQCNHPADSLKPFELISDCCVCGECGAVLKDYVPREAAALGIDPGWTRLDAGLLEAEIRRVFKPVLDLLDDIRGEVGQYGDCHDVMEWGDMALRNEAYKKLGKVR